ncbi:hypothetical protein ACEN2J_14625 [Pseudorhodobacter sp. W20_MBD10_FR17]|uniref:hypothetical protein n=1 Tax=Pseudorhodobacter sp. W20_MBD10_FR17 TaxID=3240266 RepID=UPI003F986583
MVPQNWRRLGQEFTAPATSVLTEAKNIFGAKLKEFVAGNDLTEFIDPTDNKKTANADQGDTNERRPSQTDRQN